MAAQFDPKILIQLFQSPVNGSKVFQFLFMTAGSMSNDFLKTLHHLQ